MHHRRRRTGKVGLLGPSINPNSCHTWPSRFMSVVLILLFAKAITTTAQNSNGSKMVDPPLLISTHDVTLKVGESSDVLLTPTIHFKPVFQNISKSVVLVFHPSRPGIIQNLENVTLVGPQGDNKTVPIEKNSTLHVVALKAGLVTVSTELIPNISIYKPTNIFLRISVYKLETLVLISSIVGWIYFFAWSISFYPQMIQNYQRKSVRGLSLDFVFLNWTGFAVYSVYNIGLYWFASIRQEYYAEYPEGVIPVQLNDLMFSVHALTACTLIMAQCLIYDRGTQTISDSGKMLLCTFFVFIFVIFIVAASQAISWLTFLTWCSYVKLVITLIKYMPQAYLNWYRKSTSGWCIGNVLLDFTGGVFSLAQMSIIAFNHNDWSSFFGDMTKFGLGLFSILFDVFFMVQHYILYRHHDEYEPIEGGDNQQESNQYGDITTSNHHFAASMEADNNGNSGSSANASIEHKANVNFDADENRPTTSAVITGNAVPVMTAEDYTTNSSSARQETDDTSDSDNNT